MQAASQYVFALVLLLATYFIYKRAKQIIFNIRLGQSYVPEGSTAGRWKNMLLMAFGQKKMFQKPLIGLMHFIIYAGFIIINIEVLEIVLDGLLGSHRIFAAPLGQFYPLVINVFEGLALGVIVVCVVFLIRRNILKVKRFTSAEMTRWPRLDANIILFVEIALMTAFLTMNASDNLLQQRSEASAHYLAVGPFWISSMLSPLLDGLSTGALLVIERFGWWFHIVGILAFAVYVTYSKHLHIFLSFPNTYFKSEEPVGRIANMPDVTREVNIMLGFASDQGEAAPEGKKFGAKDVTDLSWKNLLDAYSCTECGRCTASCPANLTGKKLSPRKIMMDTRDRAEELGEYRMVGIKDPKIEANTLLDQYISREEILACTTCNACVEACPVNINPLDIIVQLRRFSVMEESSAPGQWNAMFANLENNMAPWKFAPSDRANWIEKVNPNT